MYLEADTYIEQNGLIGLFDTDQTTVQKATREFLAAAEQNGTLHVLAGDLPRSYAVCDDAVWLCSHNVNVLKLRMTEGI